MAVFYNGVYRAYIQRAKLPMQYNKIILYFRSYQLERLILRDCHWVTRDAIEYHTFKQGLRRNDNLWGETLSQLSSQCVRIGRNNNMNQEYSPKSNLQEVIFTGCWELNDQVMINFVSKFPYLRLVKLGNIYSITDETMNGIARYCPHLHTLEITGCWRVTDQGKNNKLLTLRSR